MKVRKAVVPAAGWGTRMLPITKAQPKEMVPVVHKPVIQYVVEEAYYSGLKEILIITGKHKRAIEDHFDRTEVPKKDKYLEELDRILDQIQIFFIRQKEQKGLGDAVKYAEAFVGDEPFALLLGDNITIPPCTKLLLEKFGRLGKSIIAVEEVSWEKVSQHGIIKGKEIEPDIILVEDMVEKPPSEKAPSNLAIIGRYILQPEVFEYLSKLEAGYGGEIQLTDALKLLTTKNGVFALRYSGKRYDIGNKLDWLRANLELSLEDEEVGDNLKVYIKKLEI
jgi:UTP--glucose-1-phosphate uridylyltransferase